MIIRSRKRNRIFKFAKMNNIQLDSTIYSLLVNMCSHMKQLQIKGSSLSVAKLKTAVRLELVWIYLRGTIRSYQYDFWPGHKMLTKTRELKKKKIKLTKTCRKYHIIYYGSTTWKPTTMWSFISKLEICNARKPHQLIIQKAI